MDPVLVSLLTLRSLGTLFQLQGHNQGAQLMNGLVDMYQSGQNIDSHMQAVADSLKDNGGADWDDIMTRIGQAEDALLMNGPDPESDPDPEGAPV